MYFLAGVVSFIQVFFLPALVFQSFFPQKNLILLVPFNMLINFFIALLLIVFNENNSSSWWFIFLFESAILFISYAYSKKEKFFKFSSSLTLSWVNILLASFSLFYSLIKLFQGPAETKENLTLFLSLNFSLSHLFMDNSLIPFFSSFQIHFLDLLCVLTLFAFFMRSKNSLFLIMAFLVSLCPKSNVPLFYFSLFTLCTYIKNKSNLLLLGSGLLATALSYNSFASLISPFLLWPLAKGLDFLLNKIKGPYFSFPLWKIKSLNYQMTILLFFIFFFTAGIAGSFKWKDEKLLLLSTLTDN